MAMRRTWRTGLLAISIAMGSSALETLPAFSQSILRVAPETLSRILDPHFTTSFTTRDLGYLIYDTLFAVDDTFTPKPQMVESYTVSLDKLTYLFVLRPGLKWHDGQPVTAADCVASIRRWASRDSMGQTLTRFLAALEATDASTIKLVLKEPYGMVLESLGKVGAPVPFMMPERIARTPGNEQVKEIIGSGPYRFRADLHEPGVKIVLEKFTDYTPRREPPNWASGGKIAKLDRVEMLGLPDAQTQVSALIRGEVDYLERVPADLLPLFDSQSGGKASAAKAEVVSKLGFQAIMRMNHLQPPFDNLKVRQAIARAIDRSLYAAVVAGDPSFATDCAAVFGCGMPYESKDGIPTRDMAAAKAMLAEAGVDFSKPIVMLHVANAPGIAALGNVTRQVLVDLGFKVDMQAMDFQTFATRRLNTRPVSEGGWNLAHTTNTVPDQGNPLSNPFLVASGPPASAWGWPNDLKTDELRLKFATAPDAAAQKAIASEIQARSYEQVLYLPLAQFTTPSAWRNNLEGVLRSPAMLLYNIDRK
ncbi:ABC transporter substrate-binding protein [Reyranella sp.]|uniref:ABC transporter substrate-binding protein n=1 Tax=Reyranella sp. TaxID=1929291 RepID=UPI003783DC9D